MTKIVSTLLTVMLLIFTAVAMAGDAELAQAFRQHQGNLQTEGEGTVIKLLPGDNHGSRHQRFILRLASGQTLLVAHNIDLAPRIDGLRVGDTVAFFGEYEWSDKGGSVHWVHHDPAGRHVAGWLRHGGKVYQLPHHPDRTGGSRGHQLARDAVPAAGLSSCTSPVPTSTPTSRVLA